MVLDENQYLIPDPSDTRDLTPQPRTELTDEEIVWYYYKQVGIRSPLNLPRDKGGVRILVKQVGLDMTLFAIDCLATIYLEDESRSIPPRLINASNYMNEAQVRLGEARIVQLQFGVGPG